MTFRCLLAGVLLAASLVATPARADGTTASPDPSHWKVASLDQYRKHLQDLATLVEACAKARDLSSCDPEQVGPDDRLSFRKSANDDPDGRLVRYGWLRVLLSKAQDKDQNEQDGNASQNARNAPFPQGTLPPRRTTTELLQDAAKRLARDLAQADGSTDVRPRHDHERSVMTQVLAGREFRDLEESTARDTILEKFGNWLNSVFESAAQLSARSAWIGRALIWGFIVAVCVALLWGLLQLERRWRLRLIPEGDGPAPGAASARDWQLWLEDARQAAAVGKWREAVHFLYWASISRLESRRLWPADRARTPREYLALVAPEDPRKAGLAALTGSFERFWYGGRAAGEGDYAKAEQLAAALISGDGAATVRIEGGSAR